MSQIDKGWQEKNDKEIPAFHMCGQQVRCHLLSKLMTNLIQLYHNLFNCLPSQDSLLTHRHKHDSKIQESQIKRNKQPRKVESLELKILR